MNQFAFINDIKYPFTKGETIYTFVEKHFGKGSIPTLCNIDDKLDPYGSCRVCSVEVSLVEEGKRKVQASCHTPVIENSYIYTDSSKVTRIRKNILELVITDHPLDCLTCEVSGNCELQDVAAKVGISEIRYPKGDNHLDREKDLDHPYMKMDLSKCINCYRCVRACDEIQGEFVLSVSGRGFDSKIIAGMDEGFKESSCVSCGACSQACPTAAISDVHKSKSVAHAKKTQTICTYCGVGCNLKVSSTDDNILSIQAPYEAEANGGHTCLKGRYAFKFYNHKDRLRTPLIRKNGELVPCTFEEAYDFVESKLKKIKSEFGGDAIAGLSSSRCTNEENYLMQKFIRAVIGTNNIDGCARVCHSPTALGMQRVFGTGAATNSIDDLKDTNCVMIIGANPTEAHPVTGARIKQEVMKGTKLIVLDPRVTTMARYSDYHIQLRPGTNVAILNMFCYYLITENCVDDSFVKNRTNGYEEFKTKILKLDLDQIEEISGVQRELVRKAAICYGNSNNAMSFHGLGVTEHFQGTKTVMLIAQIAAMTGNIGRRGVGVNPLRGQNNVQGLADMGVQPHQGAGYRDLLKPGVNEIYSEHYGVDIPKEPGLKIPHMFDAAVEGKLKAMWVIGEDPAQTDPNTIYVKKALNALDLLVVQELFLTETAKMADVVFPGASFLEKNGTFTNGERRIQKVQEVVKPLKGTKVDGQIIIDMMKRFGFEQKDYDASEVLEEISQIVPFFKGVRWDNLGTSGKQWPVVDGGKDTKILHVEKFNTEDGKANFSFFDFEETREISDYSDQYPFILTTNRLLEHYNCGAMTRRTGNGEIVVEDTIMINKQDADVLGIQTQDWVKIRSPRGEINLKASVTDEVKPGILSTTFHFDDTLVNILTSDVHDSDALCPEFKVCSVDIEKVPAFTTAQETAH